MERYMEVAREALEHLPDAAGYAEDEITLNVTRPEEPKVHYLLRFFKSPMTPTCWTIWTPTA